MTDTKKSARNSPDLPPEEGFENPAPDSSEAARVWAALEQARQNVKPIVRKEREAEIASAELLNLRLKASS